MTHIKKILASTKNYKITYHVANQYSNKCIITFGEIDSTLEEVGFGSKLILSEGFDHIYVAQRRQTQYQFLSADKFSSIIKNIIKDKEIYTYGSSLGAYCAIYYGGVINANILAFSPRIPAHPIIDKLTGNRFGNRGFRHNEITDEKKTNNKVYILYDKNNYIDRYYTDIYLKSAYPVATYFHVENAGHYTARALLLSGELKKVALNFFNNKEISFSLSSEEVLDWHLKRAKVRIKSNKLSHALENIEVLLSSKIANDQTVRDLVNEYRNKLVVNKRNVNKNKMHPVISSEERNQINNAVSLSFVGDLILLRDQVLNSYNPKTDAYEFDDMFTYVKKYLTESDFSMGVLEGPTAGVKHEYSTSCYGDGIPLYLNFPDSFADAISRAGFDFVTTAQNHLLDRGIDGAMRTLDVLDKAGLKHLGSYRNSAEKDKLPIFNIKGLKVAILTYTRYSNRYKNSFFLEEENKHLTSLIVSPNDENFERVRGDVINDFERIKKENPDCIVVLPHMGKQFRHSPDNYQKTWVDIFVEAGADIILNDHPHAVQPYEWRKSPEKHTNVLILHCPGNFVNSYTKNNGDASALTEIYLNPKNGEPFAVACLPLYAHSYLDSNYKALPIFDIINNPNIRKSISSYEFNRIEEVHELITNTMLGEKLSIDQAQEKYFLFAERSSNNSKGYVRNHVKPVKITNELKNKKLYKLLSESKNVCFIGDFITEGNRNGGYGWYEPLIENFDDLNVKTFAKGSATSSYLLNHVEEFAQYKADIYIIAVGINDIRYRNPRTCAMDPEEYIKNLEHIMKKVKSKKKTAKFVFIAPWTTDSYDPISKLPKNKRFRMLKEYSYALEKFSKETESLYINPNPIIEETFKKGNPKIWLKDQIHPNAFEGINLYSYAVLKASPKSRLFPFLSFLEK